jgi:hypothetical protein
MLAEREFCALILPEQTKSDAALVAINFLLEMVIFSLPVDDWDTQA